MVFSGCAVALSPDDAGSRGGAILIALNAGAADIGTEDGYFDLAVAGGVFESSTS